MSLWSSNYPTHLTKLKRLQNKATRIIPKIPIKTKITPQNLKFEILKLDDLHHFEMAKKCINLFTTKFLLNLIVISNIHLKFQLKYLVIFLKLIYFYLVSKIQEPNA